MRWFDYVDIETPFKAIGTTTKESNGETYEISESRRFETRDAAIDYFNQCKGRCIVSHHDFHREVTNIKAYKFNR